MDVSHDEGDLTLILLCFLLTSCANFKDTILYSSDTLTLDEVYDGTLFSKEKIKHITSGFESQTEGLFAQGRTQEKKTNDEIPIKIWKQGTIIYVIIGRRS